MGCKVSLGGGLVERWFFRVWSRWPLMVETERGGCLRTRADVRPGKPVMRFWSRAVQRVERTGEKRAAWANATSSAGVAEKDAELARFWGLA